MWSKLIWRNAFWYKAFWQKLVCLFWAMIKAKRSWSQWAHYFVLLWRLLKLVLAWLPKSTRFVSKWRALVAVVPEVSRSLAMMSGSSEQTKAYLRQMLICEEGFQAQAYHCSEGVPTIGYGFRIGPPHTALKHYESLHIPRVVADLWLEVIVNALQMKMVQHPRLKPLMAKLNEPRQAVLVSMAYQLGVEGLLAFNKTLSLLEDGHPELAAAEMLDSLWAKQTPQRAQRQARQMRTGQWCEEYIGAGGVM